MHAQRAVARYGCSVIDRWRILMTKDNGARKVTGQLAVI